MAKFQSQNFSIILPCYHLLSRVLHIKFKIAETCVGTSLFPQYIPEYIHTPHAHTYTPHMHIQMHMCVHTTPTTCMHTHTHMLYTHSYTYTQWYESDGLCLSVSELSLQSREFRLSREAGARETHLRECLRIQNMTL